MKVVMPEFDGRIIGPVVGFRQQGGNGNSTSESESRSIALADRLRACVDLASRHSVLGRKPNAEKRLALVLTNFANRHGRIGSAVGLDTPASVINLLRGLRERGYHVGEIPADGAALMEELIARGGYDREFLTEQQMRFATASYTAGTYEKWFSQFPTGNQAALEASWGAPPGAVFRREDDIYVAGKLYGNVFVMIQPPRGFGENPLAVYHSGDLIPTHHYLGAYRWLRDVFRADAIVQCGKHGTLEWLQGKGLGLSEECYPELAIGDLPVFYPFIINDPGEGTQAKRRMHACIIDHLIPPMTQAETYDELARLQQLLGTYANAERIDPEKLPLIQQEIWDAVVAANLHQDLGVEAQPEDAAYGEFIQHIDGYLCEIGDLQIRDGLHVLGQMPGGDQLINLALAQPEFFGGVSVYSGLRYESPKTALTGDGSVSYFFSSTGAKLRAHAGSGYRAPAIFERFGSSYFNGVFSPFGDPRLNPDLESRFQIQRPGQSRLGRELHRVDERPSQYEVLREGGEHFRPGILRKRVPHAGRGFHRRYGLRF